MSDGEKLQQASLPWAEPIERVGTYTRMQTHAGEVVRQLGYAWKRPVRHNRRIERAALWYTLHVARDCDRILDPAGTPDYVQPVTGDALARYDTEAAIRTIPETLPLTRREREILSGNQDRRNFEFEHGIGNVALGQLALVERWHEWLWTTPTTTSARRASPNPTAELLIMGCARLANGLARILWPSDQDRPND